MAKKFLCVIVLMVALACVLASCQGEKDDNASTPTIEISDDGYWIINGEKTDVKAENKDEQDNSNDNQQTPPAEEKDPIENFSPILQTVLKSEYYNEIIRQAKVEIAFKEYSHRTSNRYQAIPYGFLEDEGYDVEAIKNDEIKCESDVFVLDEDLYIACRVENKASTPYYTHYVIRYDLTKQELNDLKLTHYEISDGSNISRTVSFQAPLFIQELSLVKNAEKLSETNMAKVAKEDYEYMISAEVIPNNPSVDMSGFNFDWFQNKYTGSSVVTVTWIDFWNETGEINTFKFLFFHEPYKAAPVIQTKNVATICLTGYGGPVTHVDGKQVYIGYGIAHVEAQYYNEVANSKRKATFYNTYDSSFVDMLSPEYDHFYGLEK